MAGQDEITSHYAIEGLLDRMLGSLGVSDRSPGSLPAASLRAVDEFHINGAEATERLIPELRVAPGGRVLDLGSGVGGPARHVAEATAAEVTGIELTPVFRDVAEALSVIAGLDGRTRFVLGSATELPFDAGSFDAAMLFHVGMNIADKAAVMAEAARVLRPGGRFVVYEVMRLGEGQPAFPVPWASGPGASFLETPLTYRRLAEAAGFEVIALESRAEAAKAFFARMRAALEAAKAEGRPQPPGLGSLLGAEAPAKIANMIAALADGVIAPVELILERAATDPAPA
ncbi:class I SAM-dependent methyltransferase [Frigidibacter sp. MR17.24]|uniref:class I SAM-dependent methyltransferase n=1 Tax=Frigidibacter sp. MR17.24 TaxID=3127345 RepID=UPI003012B352